MTEPLFFDCLTDAQFWSLFDSGVLQAYMLPEDVFRRLERLAPAHGCYLFAWTTDLPLPVPEDIVPSLRLPGQESPHQAYANGLQTPMRTERMRSEIEAFCARRRADMPSEGGRIHVIRLNPVIEVRAGPYLEPRPRDLSSMSMPELEAYLDATLYLGEGNAIAAAGSDIPGPLKHSHDHAPPWVAATDMTHPA
jgi:hypothetical protein